MKILTKEKEINILILPVFLSGCKYIIKYQMMQVLLKKKLKKIKIVVKLGANCYFCRRRACLKVNNNIQM